jgi:hypothetical protein
MVTKKASWLAIVMVLASVLFAHVQTASGPADQFVIGPGEVLAPKGVFFLVRKGRKIGAIRFTSIEQGKEVGSGKATYESYFQGDSSGSFHSSNVQKETGFIHLKPLEGIGRASFQFGKDKVKVGKWAFRSSRPGGIDMWPYRGSEKDYGYEFAPTSARDVAEIDASDKRLRWFRFDKDSRVMLPVADLPK